MKTVRRILDRYRSTRPALGSTPSEVIVRENKWRLLRYCPKGPRQSTTPVLLVPSLINRHYVLDLLPGRSFAEFLVEAGHDVYIIDWGTPTAEDRYVSFDTVCDRYLGRAVRWAARTSGTEDVHLLGYCLGGTLTTIYAAARPEKVRSLTALAAPINFHDDGLLSLWTRTPAFDVKALVQACGNVPWPLMQASFHMLKPTLNLLKGRQLLQRAMDDEFLDTFVAIETWGNDNVSFPGACYQRYIEALYRENALVEGRFTLSGRPAMLESIRCPTLAVTFQHDHIVPHQSASVLLEHISSDIKKHLQLRGGHVGAVISKRAKTGLWLALSEWWQALDAPINVSLKVEGL